MGVRVKGEERDTTGDRNGAEAAFGWALCARETGSYSPGNRSYCRVLSNRMHSFTCILENGPGRGVNGGRQQRELGAGCWKEGQTEGGLGASREQRGRVGWRKEAKREKMDRT